MKRMRKETKRAIKMRKKRWREKGKRRKMMREVTRKT